MTNKSQIYGKTLRTITGEHIGVYTSVEGDKVYTEIQCDYIDDPITVIVDLVSPTHDEVKQGNYIEFLHKHVDILNEVLKINNCEDSIDLLEFSSCIIYQSLGKLRYLRKIGTY